MGKVTANAPSRQRVVCGHRGCSHETELRNMKKHNERKHGGVMRIKNTSFGVGGKWAKWNATTRHQEAVQPSQERGMSMLCQPLIYLLVKPSCKMWQAVMRS